MKKINKRFIKVTVFTVAAIFIAAAIFSTSAFTITKNNLIAAGNVAGITSKSNEVSTVGQDIVYNSKISPENVDAENIEEIRDNLKTAIINESDKAKEINDENLRKANEVAGLKANETETVTVVQEQAPLANNANLNDYETAVLNLINNTRVANGLCPLASNQSLTDIARGRCSDMIGRNYFAHYTPDGKTIFNIMQECGVCYRNAGENLAQATPASLGSPDAFMNAWMNSPTHKANILRSVYGMVGIGVVNSGNRIVVTTVFRNP